MPKSTIKNSFNIRKAVSADIDSIHIIEINNASNPWKKDAFIHEISNNLASFYIIEADEKVCGFIIFWIIGDEAELHNISVSPDMKKRGVASHLLDKMVDETKGVCSKIYLEVRASNRPAISLYEKYRFTKTGIRKSYYSNPVEDALIFSLQL